MTTPTTAPALIAPFCMLRILANQQALPSLVADQVGDTNLRMSINQSVSRSGPGRDIGNEQRLSRPGLLLQAHPFGSGFAGLVVRQARLRGK